MSEKKFVMFLMTVMPVFHVSVFGKIVNKLCVLILSCGSGVKYVKLHQDLL
jgi:hypothetical protein